MEATEHVWVQKENLLYQAFSKIFVLKKNKWLWRSNAVNFEKLHYTE